MKTTITTFLSHPFLTESGADPELVVGGGANLFGGGRRPNILIHFLKNPMKLKKFWFVGGRGARRERPPPKSATVNHLEKAMCRDLNKNNDFTD